MRCNVYSTNRCVCWIDVIREAHNAIRSLIDSLVTYALSRNEPTDECGSIHRIDPRTKQSVHFVITVSVAQLRLYKTFYKNFEGIREVFIFSNVYYRPQRSYGKVMFSQASLILFTKGVSDTPQADNPPGQIPPGQTPPPPPGRHDPPTATAADYWNAFLF